MVDERLLRPPKGAYWFELQRDVAEQWQPVQADGGLGPEGTWFRIDKTPTPEQLALADAAGAGATYRVEWRQKDRKLRSLGTTVPFTVPTAAPPAFVAAASNGKRPDEPSPDDDAEQPDDDDEQPDDDDEQPDDDDEQPEDTEPAPASPAPIRKRRPPYRPPSANGNGHAAANGLDIVQTRHAAAPPYAHRHDPYMFSFQAFDYLKHSTDRDAERAEAERARRDARDREYMATILATLMGQSKENSSTMQTFFERMMKLERERGEAEAERRAAEAERDAAPDDAPNEAMMAALVEQLAQIKAQIAASKDGADLVDNDGNAIDLGPYIKAVGGFARFLSNTPWAKEKWPELGELFTANVPTP